MNIQSRRAVAAEWLAAGGRVAAVTPISYPRALLRAHGFLPMEIWGPPGVSPALADPHIQSYACSVVRSITAFLLGNGAREASVLVMPHACDSLQGATGVLANHAKPGMPVIPIYLPRTTGQAAAEYLEAELRSVGARLAAISGVEPHDKELAEQIHLEEEADRASLEFISNVLPESGNSGAAYGTLRLREYLPAERYLEALQSFVPEPADPDTTPLLLSGVLPEPMSLFDVLKDSGARVVADDMACISRRMGPPGTSNNPYRRMAEALLSQAPEPMRGSDLTMRVARLRELCARTGARGVLFWVVKYCEQELFDLPVLQSSLKDLGIRSILLELELTQPLPMQVSGRLEAFCEMLR